MPHKGKKGHRRGSMITKDKKPLLPPKISLKRKANDLPSDDKNFSAKKQKLRASKKAKKFSSPNDESNIPKKSQVEKEADDARFRRKHGRIIIRNLPFKVTEDKLRKYVESYGEIEEVNILRRPDGKLVGCGFVQFASQKSAEKAILECNAKPFLGRPIIFDWAVPKKVFKANFKLPSKNTDVSEKDNSNEIVEIKEEKIEKDEVKEEDDTEEEDEVEEDDMEEDDDDEAGNCDESLDESEEENKRWGPKKNMKPANQRRSFQPSVHSSENEGCTVFIKNVSFETTNEELKDFMESFGPVAYALICKDPLTEHSRGTAFVKFKKKESADKCMSAGSEDLTLDGSVLSAMPALSREEAKRKVDEEKEKSPKDARNLYLTKEGVIIAGSKAASGVSVSDMTKRVKLDQWKNQILKNLKMFVSRYRLVIHNLPPTYADRQLRKLFLEYAGPGAVIKEAKVMRDLKKVDGAGLGQSKGYGFVSFTKHEHALAALRNINNNPEIFKPDQRPIVAFSIENKTIINAKKKRLLKSQAMNPLFQEKDKKGALGDGKQDKRGKAGRAYSKEKNSEELVPSFGGLACKPGPSKLRSRYKISNQIKIHTDTVKKNKQKKKALQQPAKIRQVSDGRSQASKEKKFKRKTNMDDAAFVNLVKKYKTKLVSAPQKWYENGGT